MAPLTTSHVDHWALRKSLRDLRAWTVGSRGSSDLVLIRSNALSQPFIVSRSVQLDHHVKRKDLPFSGREALPV